MAKTAVLELLDCPKLISRKIWIIENPEIFTLWIRNSREFGLKLAFCTDIFYGIKPFEHRILNYVNVYEELGKYCKNISFLI